MPRDLKANLDENGVDVGIDLLQKSVLLGTATISRKDLEKGSKVTSCDLASRKTPGKHSCCERTIIIIIIIMPYCTTWLAISSYVGVCALNPTSDKNFFISTGVGQVEALAYYGELDAPAPTRVQGGTFGKCQQLLATPVRATTKRPVTMKYWVGVWQGMAGDSHISWVRGRDSLFAWSLESRSVYFENSCMRTVRVGVSRPGKSCMALLGTCTSL